jgi:hypothetical protein
MALPPLSASLLQDCQGMTSCLKTCQQTCPKQQVVVNGFACDSYGKSVAGPVEASRACELAMVSDSTAPNDCQNRLPDQSALLCRFET